MQEDRHSGARAPPASPESRNTDQRNQSLGLCSWVPGPVLTGRPGMTRQFFQHPASTSFPKFRTYRSGGEIDFEAPSMDNRVAI
jgi:hypothetical protein